MDKRAARAQALLWQVQALREAGEHEAAARKSREMARLHEALAAELLDAGEAKGWIHLFAAITAWAKAGGTKDLSKSVRLFEAGYAHAFRMDPVPESVLEQLRELMMWLVTKPQNGETSLNSYPNRVVAAELAASFGIGQQAIQYVLQEELQLEADRPVLWWTDRMRMLDQTLRVELREPPSVPAARRARASDRLRRTA